MKEKIKKLEDIRNRVEILDVKDSEFTDKLQNLSQETLGYCEEADDEQEINWLKKTIKISETLKKSGNESENALEQKNLGLSYLNEAVNSVLIRERRYID